MKVVIVTFENDYLARCYVADTQLAWPVLVDADREVYKGYGMLAAAFWDVWGIKSWLVYLEEVRKGNMPKKSAGDIYQRGGDVLIDPAGIVRLHHVGEGPADRPSVTSVLNIITSQAWK